MGIGRFVRRSLGPMERCAAVGYRRLFVDLETLAEQVMTTIQAGRILEVGCGEGMFTELLAKRYPSASILGIDIDHRAGRLFRGDHERVTFRVQTAVDCAAANPESFDLAALCDVLHHVPPAERSALLSAVKECIVPGGFLVVKDWERGRNLPHLLNYASDRFVSGTSAWYASAAAWRAVIEETFGAHSIQKETRVGPHWNNLAFFIRRR